MGVLMKSGSGLKLNEMAEMGVAEVISEGKVAVTGVVSFPNLGLAVGMVMIVELNVLYCRDKAVEVDQAESGSLL